MNYGFQPSKIEQGDYVLGSAAQLKGEVLQSTGQWDEHLPTVEYQSREGFETYACVSFAITSAVETLIRRKFLENKNLSDRFLSYATGTKEKQGNDPTTVCKFLGKRGDVNEVDWAYPSPAADFYNAPPQNLYTLALEFPAHYEYDNQWVPATPDAMMDALTRSPLTVAVYAWEQNADGLYYLPDGAMPNHYVLIHGYERNRHWFAFDTYSNEFKKLVWNYPFMQVKEHSLSNQVVVPSAWKRFVQLLRQILGFEGDSLGAVRSPRWSEVRNAFLKANPECEACGSKGKLLTPLNVHHCTPFSQDKSLELQESNLITLCQRCHLLLGHLGSFRSWNVDIRTDARIWRGKIEERP